MLGSGDLDAVDLAHVLGLPADKRIDSLPKVLIGVRVELADQRYQGEPRAAELDEHIEIFTRETIVRDLQELPQGS